MRGTFRRSNRSFCMPSARSSPPQVIIYSPKGTNNTVHLLFGTSLYDLKTKKMLSKGDVVERDGLRLYSPAAALTKVPQAFYIRQPGEAQAALAGIRDPSDVLSTLLGGGHSVVAWRLAGALRHIGRDDMADEILSAEGDPVLRNVMKREGGAQIMQDIALRTYWANTNINFSC